MLTGCGLKGDEPDKKCEETYQDCEGCGGGDDLPDQAAEPYQQRQPYQADEDHRKDGGDGVGDILGGEGRGRGEQPPVEQQRQREADLQRLGLARQVQLTWRISRPLKRNMFEIAQVLVGSMSRAWWRAREGRRRAGWFPWRCRSQCRLWRRSRGTSRRPR